MVLRLRRRRRLGLRERRLALQLTGKVPVSGRDVCHLPSNIQPTIADSYYLSGGNLLGSYDGAAAAAAAASASATPALTIYRKHKYQRLSSRGGPLRKLLNYRCREMRLSPLFFDRRKIVATEMGHFDSHAHSHSCSSSRARIQFPKLD